MSETAKATDLIKRAQGGNARAFEALVESHYEVMFKMAFKWCGNRNDAEDITQDACIKLARGLHGFRHDCAFTSWLFRLVINAAKDWYRTQNRHPQHGDAGMDTVPTDENAENALYAKQVWAGVYGLPEGEKEAILLVMVEGLTHAQAAKLLNIKESTVSGRIHEARKKLNALFGKEHKYG